MSFDHAESSGQQERILDLLKSRGYGQWVERYEFLDLQPRICDFTTRIFELRHKRDLNIECQIKTVNGEKHSRYRLLPGSWRELRGKPEKQGDTRQERLARFEREFRPRHTHPFGQPFSEKRMAEPDCLTPRLPFTESRP